MRQNQKTKTKTKTKAKMMEIKETMENKQKCWMIEEPKGIHRSHRRQPLLSNLSGCIVFSCCCCISFETQRFQIDWEEGGSSVQGG